MNSLVMYSNEYDRQMDMGLSPEQYKYRFLAEGDSWMDRSSMFETSLLQKLAAVMDDAGEPVLIINLAMFGDTMRRIGSMAGGDFRLWIDTTFNWKFDALLLSAGGNDFIDAARDPGPGQGILKSLTGGPVPARGRDCIKANAVSDLKARWLDPNFKALYDRVQASRCANTPLMLNCYDTPTARHAPAFSGGKAWLAAAYQKNGIPPSLWPDLTESIFSDLGQTIAGWSSGRPNIHTVPTSGVLTQAAAGSTGSSGDWLNEIHPNAAGWRKQAAVWRAALKKVLPA